MTETPTLVLTRPRAASERFAGRFPKRHVVISPVIEIVGTGADVDLSRYRGVILTSANAVAFLPDLTGVPAWCVGARTAEASGADIQMIALDAEELVSGLRAEGPLLHAHGRTTRGGVAKRLTSQGIETDSVVIYEQEPCDLTAEAKASIEGSAPAILPLWSPRSASLVAAQVRPGTALRVIALSQAVAETWSAATGGSCEVCDRPTATEMEARIVAAFDG